MRYLNCFFCEKALIKVPHKKIGKFCGSPCSAKYNNEKKDYSFLHKFKKTRCIICEKATKIKKTASILTAHCRRCAKKRKVEFRRFYQQCVFRFDVCDFPQEFDLKLVDRHGWYSSRKRNMMGISKDHKMSVKYAFDNGVEPKLVRHPANCELMSHIKNVRKGVKHSLEEAELISSIERWNKKYGSDLVSIVSENL